jgi:hypothetical protein
MKKISLIVFGIMLFVAHSSAYIEGWNISVGDIQSALDPNHHNMANYGVNGCVFWIDIPQGQYYVRSGEQVSGSMRLIIDGEDTGTKRTWIALLMQAKATGGTIAFHASHLGGGNMRAYYISVK